MVTVACSRLSRGKEGSVWGCCGAQHVWLACLVKQCKNLQTKSLEQALARAWPGRPWANP